MSKELNVAHKSRHIFKEYAYAYRKKNYSVIPDKFMKKMPAIKAWTDYCYKLPSYTEIESWIENFKETNIALAMGQASRIIAIDVDTEDPLMLKFIEERLEPSPVEKFGQKGFTRFYKYNGEISDQFKFNGEVVFELLSDKKKTTIPPSIHPVGDTYIWKDKGLLDINWEDLPELPHGTFKEFKNTIRSNFSEVIDLKTGYAHLQSTGRNSDLMKKSRELIKNESNYSEALRKLVQYDKENHEVPYFTDPDEAQNNCTDAYTNANMMLAQQQVYINAGHFTKNEEYETLNIDSAINEEYKEALHLGKSLKQGKEKRSKNLELPHAQGVLKTIQQNILANSYVKQPALAFSAALSLLGTIVSRKIMFRGNTPNLYLLNIAPSGDGKDAPQKQIIKYLTEIGADYLIGAGDYVSDASLMDGLEASPTRLDVLDEAGGILKTFTSGGNDYSSKMADILCELYTTSNGKFRGRAVAGSTKGSCYRPHVNILASTTPTGFSEGVSTSAIEKGLMGRFIVFFGSTDQPSVILEEFPKLDLITKNFIRHWVNFEAEVNEDVIVGGIEQKVMELKCTDEAKAYFHVVHKELDSIRISSEPTDPLRPIMARLYQQMSRICMIHAVSRCGVNEPIIDVCDIKFAKATVLYYYENMKIHTASYIYRNNVEKDYATILDLIPFIGTEGLTKLSLSRKTRHMSKRDFIVRELLESGEIITDIKIIKGKRNQVYWRV